MQPKTEKNHQDARMVDEGLFLVFLATSLFLFLALVSFSPFDPSPYAFSMPELAVKNWCGSLGSELSGFLIYQLGAVAFFLPLATVIFAFERYLAKRSFLASVLTLFGLTSILACSAFYLSFLRPTLHFKGLDFASAGHIGILLREILPEFLGPIGVHTSLSLCIILGIMALRKRTILIRK